MDLLAEAVARVARGDHGAYERDRHGSYVPRGWEAGPPSLFQRERVAASATILWREQPAEVERIRADVTLGR